MPAYSRHFILYSFYKKRYIYIYIIVAQVLLARFWYWWGGESERERERDGTLLVVSSIKVIDTFMVIKSARLEQRYYLRH
jgi:hypothetical protein